MPSLRPLGLSTRGACIRRGVRDLVLVAPVPVPVRPTDGEIANSDVAPEAELQKPHAEEILVRESSNDNCVTSQSRYSSTAAASSSKSRRKARVRSPWTHAEKSAVNEQEKDPIGEKEDTCKRERNDEEHVVNTVIPSLRATLPETGVSALNRRAQNNLVRRGAVLELKSPSISPSIGG